MSTAAPAAPVTAAPASTQPAPAARPAALGAGPKTGPVSTPAKNLVDAFSQLDKLGGDIAPEPEPKPQPKPGDKKPDADPKQQAPKEGEKPADEKKDTQFPSSDDAPKMRTGELSRHYKALKAAYDISQREKAELSSRPVDTEKLTRLETEAKQRQIDYDNAQAELRYTRYEKSAEYQDKYWKPYEKAFNEGADKVSKFTVVARSNEDTGEVTQPARQGTRADFDNLMSIIDDNKAAEVAEQLFGVKAPLVLMARDKALTLNTAREEAIAEYRTKGAEFEKARAESSQKFQSEISGLFESEAKAAVEKYPVWFKPVEGDDKGNELLQRGMEWTDAAYKGEFKDEKGNIVKLTPQEVAKRQSAIRNKAAAFDRMVYRNQNLLKKVAELTEKLKEYAASEPGDGDTRRAAKTASGSTMDQVLAGLK